MSRCRLLLSGALVVGTLAVPTATAVGSASATSAPCDSWRAPVSGLWSNSGNWTGGVPGEGAATPVCITVPGSYTVTLAPWAAGTSDPAHPGASIPSLTLGATQGPGKQTLLIDGLSSTSDSNEQVNNTFLSTALPSLIRARGRLVLATTEGGTKPKGVPYGGVATVSGGSFANYGTVTTTVQDLDNKAANVTQFFGALTNERGGTVVDRSGLLQVNSVTNKGTLTVAPKASLDLIAQGPGSGLPSGVVTNSGTIENGGTISAQGGTWSQLGGEVAGNPVILQDSTTLVDRAGPGKFVADSGNANLVGTVPKGQTVTVIGTGLGLAGTTVVNNGALVLEAQGPKTTGASAAIGNGTIRNNGNVIAEVVGHSTWAVNWQIGLTNNQAGRVTLTGGTLNEAGNGSDTNAGTVTVGPGAVWLLQEGSAFTNQRGGKIVPEISGPTSVGQFAVQSPCCNGAGVVNAGGALVPALVGGYTPPANKDFPVVDLEGGKFAGTFGTVGAPFSADYTHETTTPAFVGVVYKSTKPKSNKT